MEVSDKETWLKERSTGIGGSDASIILGINHWKSRLELWNEKTTGTTVEKDNMILRLGKKLEPFIIEEYVEETKRDVEAGTLALENIRSKEYPWMMCNLDGRISDKTKGKAVLECKIKSAYVKWETEIPDYYYAQIQHCMAVTGYTWASFAVLNFSTGKLEWKDVERDEEYIKNLIEEESKFWKLVIDKIPPKVDSSDCCEKFLKNSIEEKGKKVDLRENLTCTDAAFKLKHVREHIKDLQVTETECKNILMFAMDGAETATGQGYNINWKRPKDKIVFNVEQFKNENPELYNSYTTKEKQIRRFVVKYEKEK